MTGNGLQPEQAEDRKSRSMKLGLKVLLVFVLVVCVGMSLFGVRLHRVRKQRKVVQAIKEVGGRVEYDYYSPNLDVLRKWFGHDPAKWEKFRFRYEEELSKKQDLLTELKTLEHRYKTLTLLYSTRYANHHHVIVLKSTLERY